MAKRKYKGKRRSSSKRSGRRAPNYKQLAAQLKSVSKKLTACSRAVGKVRRRKAASKKRRVGKHYGSGLRGGSYEGKINPFDPRWSDPGRRKKKKGGKKKKAKKKGKKSSAWNKFFAKHRRRGLSPRTIGKMWRKTKGSSKKRSSGKGRGRKKSGRSRRDWF